VLGHSYGSFVTLQNAVDYPGVAAQSIISCGVPSARYLMGYVNSCLEAFEPIELRKQVTDSWARERTAQTQVDLESIMHDQIPFHFGNPLDPRIPDYERRSAGVVYSPDVLRHFAQEEYGGIEVEAQLGAVTSPVLVLAGRDDRTCSVEAANATAAGIPNATLTIFEHSGHMTFVEENERYLNVVRAFLDQNRAAR
jgi:proline iminopeptidase